MLPLPAFNQKSDVVTNCALTVLKYSTLNFDGRVVAWQEIVVNMTIAANRQLQADEEPKFFIVYMTVKRH